MSNIKILISLDIEHFAKTRLIRDCSENNSENGYSIVQDFFDKYSYIKESIDKKSPYTGIRKNKQINTYVSKINGVKKEERIKKLSNPIIHDFIVTLYVYEHFTKNFDTRFSTFKELKDLIDIRFIENKEYFTKNQIIVTNYKFIKKIVDYFYSNCI